MMKILIAVDGSEHANRAIEAVGKMVHSSLQVEAVFLSVDPGIFLDPLFVDGYSVTTVQKLDDAQKKRQDTILNEAMKQATAHGIKFGEPASGHGPIAKEILRIADEKNCDLIAMGTRGMGAFGNLLMGSVAQAVMQNSSVPVLLTK
jgi:nucleotide-binding universal stress UspA family protein